jgi:hypothetical protein
MQGDIDQGLETRATSRGEIGGGWGKCLDYYELR